MKLAAWQISNYLCSHFDGLKKDVVPVLKQKLQTFEQLLMQTLWNPAFPAAPITFLASKTYHL